MMKLFELITEIFGWLQIVASPFLLGLGAGFIIYLLKPDDIGFIIAVSISLIGFVFGIILATRIWKRKAQ